ncbi:MAG: single-stranded DNA-binding protein [Microbacterium sp.]
MTMSNDIVTISGNIGNDPTKNETRAGKPVINFRVGSSHRYLDQRTGEWVDGGTNWYAVSAFGNLAEHAKASLHRGDAVIVTGRLKVKEWEANGKKGIDVEIVADAIGHDLNWGTSGFARRQRPSAVQTGQSGGAPSGEFAPDGESRYDEPTVEEQDGWRANGLTVAEGLIEDDEEMKEPSYA